MLSGLPGSGKSTLAQRMSDLTGAILLRIDVFEQDLRNANGDTFDVGTQGYQIGYDLARHHLLKGKDVIADAVNAVEPARTGWRAIAEETGTQIIEIEVVCTNEDEAAQRLRTRETGIDGLLPVMPQDRRKRTWEPNSLSSGTVDTAGRPISDCVDDLLRLVKQTG